MHTEYPLPWQIVLINIFFILSLGNVQNLKVFLAFAESEVRSLASLYSSVVCI